MTSDAPAALLLHAAQHGALDSAHWPATLHFILDRLDEITAAFPRPPPPASLPPPAAAAANAHALSSQESTTTDKENAPPQTPPRPPVPAFAAPPESQMPPDVTTFYAAIRNALSSNFATHPPHTIQRLAELILEPKKPYRHLPSYLRALDRVVSVSSPLTIFPLPQAVLPTSGGLLNGTISSTSSQSASLGSDESLGGALLTPIPWLQNRGQSELISESTEMVDGPNGAGRIETVTVGMLTGGQRTDASSSQVAQIASSHPDGETLPSTGPVTQGELLRQEQEAGVVLNNPHSLITSPPRSNFIEAEAGDSIIETVEADEAPHARGPEKIGLEDTGLQKSSGGLDIEGAVGRPSVERASKSPGPAALAKEAKDEDMKDSAEKADGATASSEKAGAVEEEAKARQDVEMKS